MLNKSLKLFLRTKSGEVQDMRTVILAGLALGAAALSVPATAAGESAGTSARGHMTGVQYAPPPARPTATYRTESKVQGRWQAATQAPGGWRSYRRPVSGFTLPRYRSEEHTSELQQLMRTSYAAFCL